MSTSWRTSDLTVLVVAAIGIVLLTVASFVAAPSQTLPHEDGSSYAPHGDGARAAFLLLKELGYTVDRSFEPLATLVALPERTAIVIATPLHPPSELDRRAVRAFIEAGGVVIASGRLASGFLPGFPGRGGTGKAGVQHAALPGPLTAGVPDIEMAGSIARLPIDSPYVAVYGNPDTPAITAAQFGRGRAIWWNESRPLTNGGIARPGHAELLINALGAPGERTVLWDEFYHGHTRSLWSYLTGTPLPVAMLQAAGIGALALFTYARRRRPIRPRFSESRTSPLEFIETMGGLYQRAGSANAAVATAFARIRRLLLVETGLPPASTDDRLAAAAAERLSLPEAELSALLTNARSASVDPEVTTAQALGRVAQLQKVARRIQRSELPPEHK